MKRTRSLETEPTPTPGKESATSVHDDITAGLSAREVPTCDPCERGYVRCLDWGAELVAEVFSLADGGPLPWRSLTSTRLVVLAAVASLPGVTPRVGLHLGWLVTEAGGLQPDAPCQHAGQYAARSYVRRASDGASVAEVRGADLCERAHVSSRTAREALRDLAAAGLLERLDVAPNCPPVYALAWTARRGSAGWRTEGWSPDGWTALPSWHPEVGG